MSIRTRRNSKRLLAGVLAGAFALSGVAISSNVSADDGEVSADATQTRLGGANRYETAVAVAQRASTPVGDTTAFVNAKTVILATGENFPDGLSAAGLVGGLTNVAGSADVAVVGLTQTNALPAATAGMIEDIPTLNLVVVMGGTAAIADSVIDEIAELRGWTAAQTAANVVRIAGTNRYDTALKAVQTWVSLGAAGANAIQNCAILVTGDNFPDALSAGSLAVNNSCPILLNSGSTVRPEVTAALAAIGSANDITVVGGTTVIPNSVVAALRTAGHTVTRIAGANRYATAQAVANELGTEYLTSTTATYTSPARALLASGTEFADALSASPLTAGNTPILLAPVAAPLPTATADWLTWNSNQVNALTVIGGTAAISAEAATAARTAATAVAPAVTQTLGLFTSTANASLVIPTGSNPSAGTGVTLSANPAGPLAGPAGNGWNIDVTLSGTTSQAPVINNQTKRIALTLATTVDTLTKFRTYWNSQSSLTSRFTMSNNNITADPSITSGSSFGPTAGGAEVGFVVAVLNTVCNPGQGMPGMFNMGGKLVSGPVGPASTAVGQNVVGICGNNTQQNPLLWGGILKAALQAGAAPLTDLQVAAVAKTLPAAPVMVFAPEPPATAFTQQWQRVEIEPQAIQSSATPALVNPSTIRSNITWVPVTL